MRTRQKGSGYKESSEYAFIVFDNWTREPPEPTPVTKDRPRSDLETMTDAVTPGYFSKVASNGRLPVNPMSSQKEQVLIDDANISLNMRKTLPSGNISGVKGYYRGAFPWSQGFTGTLEDVDPGPLLVEALANARSDAWDLLTFVAEYHKTVDLVKGAADRVNTRQDKILDLIRKRRRKRVPTYRELSQEFSDMWLEYRYGWRTMAYDIQGAKAAYDALYRDAREYIRYTESQTVNGPTTESQFDALLFGVMKGRRTYSCRRTVRAGVGIEVFLDSPVSMDPLVTAYELTPWSFVLDWFFNVGDNLTAFSPFANGNLAWAFSTIVDEYTMTGDLSTDQYAAANSLSGGVPWTTVFEAKKTIKTRKVENPTFNVSFRPNLNLSKGVDLLAIATSMYARKARTLSRIANRR